MRPMKKWFGTRPNNLERLGNIHKPVRKERKEMSQPDYSGVQDVNVPHEAEVAEAVDAQMRRTSNNAAIASVTATAIPDASSAGGTYAQAEVNAIRDEVVALNARLALTVTALNLVLEVLREAELIPTS